MTVLVAAARRFAVFILSLTGGTAAASLLLGLALGSAAARAVAVGFYLVGCALLLGGFFFGSRGPFRVADEEGMVGLRRPRGVRTVSAAEHADTFNLTGLLVVAGLLLLALGAAVDSNARLV
jgi:hypothetical protein